MGNGWTSDADFMKAFDKVSIDLVLSNNVHDYSMTTLCPIMFI